MIFFLINGSGLTHGQFRDSQRELEEIGRYLRIEPESHVADVGAGGGQWSRLLAEDLKQGKVFATDVRDNQLEGLRHLARRYPNIEVIQGSQQDTGLPVDCCDAILLRLVYHAFDEPAAMRASLFAALRPGGRILIIGFRPSLENLIRDMESSGFQASDSVLRWGGQPDVYGVLFLKPASQ